MKKVISLLLALLMLTASVPAFALPSVVYRGGWMNFVFWPGSPFTDSDLFEGFKGVMPGDVLTQRVEVRNSSGKPMRIYLRAEPVDEKHVAFLDKLNLQVTCDKKEIFDAAPSQTGQLTENALLGTFKTDGSVMLQLILTVPLDLDNEHMSTMGTVPWVFVAEEVPEDETPHTGDAYVQTTWLMAAGVLLAAIVAVLIQMKRQKAKVN